MADTQHSTRKQAAGVFFAVLVALTAFAVPQRARAQLAEGVAACAGSFALQELVNQALSALGLEVPTSDTGQRVKDQIFDCIAWVAANVVLEEITDATLTWINSGFDGNPAYVEDFGGFLKGTADEAAGAFIDSTDLAFLCSPFQLEIKLALLTQQQGFRNVSRCTLTDVVENTEDFLAGDFSQGGWQGWFELTQKPQNNPYGAYLLASDELNQRIASAVGEKKTKFEIGRGFLGKEVEECSLVSTDPNFVGPPESVPPDFVGPPPPGTEIKCQSRTVTPGSTIQDALGDTLQIGTRRLEVADEINEILTALLNQLLVQVFTDDEGLRGVGDFLETAEPSEIPDTIPIPGAKLSCDPSENPQAASRPIEFSALTNDQWEVPPTGSSDQRFKLSADGHYSSAHIEFDFFLNKFDSRSEFQSVFNIRNVGSDIGCFIDMQIDGNPNRAILNTCEHGGGFYPDNNIQWKEGTWYHVTAEYSAEEGNAFVTLAITERDNPDAVLAEARGPVGTSIFPNGGGLNLIIGGEFTPDGVYRLEGSQFENVELELTPGEPYCNPVGGFDFF